MKTVAIVLGCLFAVMFFTCAGAVVMVARSMPKSSPEQIAAKKKIDDLSKQRRTLELRAVQMTELAITKILKAPTTAKFELQGYQYDMACVTVSGNVTSQNSFAAMLTQPVQAYYLVAPKGLEIAHLSLNNKSVFDDPEKFDKVSAIMKDWKEKRGTPTAP